MMHGAPKKKNHQKKTVKGGRCDYSMIYGFAEYGTMQNAPRPPGKKVNMAKTKTKAELEEAFNAANETISKLRLENTELRQQITAGVEASPVYQSALEDAKAARNEAAEWRMLYEQLKLKQAKLAPVTVKRRGVERKYDMATRQQVKAMYSSGKSMSAIAAETGICKSRIHAIIHE